MRRQQKTYSTLTELTVDGIDVEVFYDYGISYRDGTELPYAWVEIKRVKRKGPSRKHKVGRLVELYDQIEEAVLKEASEMLNMPY